MSEKFTVPLWQCISDKAIVQLILYQWDNYGDKLHLLTDVYRDVEGLKEIDRLMRQTPQYRGGQW